VKVIQAENTDHYRRYLASSSSWDQVILFRASTYTTCASNRRKKTMCDYSLHVYPNRLAVEGDELVVHRFGRASLGLASPSDLRLVINASSCQPTSKKPWSWVAIKKWFLATRPQGQPDKRTPAVCLPSRAQLLLKDIPKSSAIGTGNRGSGGGEVHRDLRRGVHVSRPVRFKNGCQLLLQALPDGQRVTVLSLTHEEVEETAFLRPPRHSLNASLKFSGPPQVTSRSQRSSRAIRLLG
jgi:hypothetical protein